MRLFIWTLMLTGFLLLAPRAHAQVRLNELFPAPSAGSEWIELVNVGAAPADLAGWQLWDELTTPSLLHTFPAGSTLSPGGFITVDVSSKLNNAADGVSLLNAATIQQDHFAYSSSSAQLSWGRILDGLGEWQLLQTPTKGLANIVNPLPSPQPSPSASPSPSPSPSSTASPSPTPFPATLALPQLSEFQACPSSGESEWVELFNPNAEAVTLINWKLLDSVGNTRIFTAWLPALGYDSFDLSSAMLNNTGDSLLLQSPTGQTADQTLYASCETEQTWQLVQGGWLQLAASRDQPNLAGQDSALIPTTATNTTPSSTPQPATPSASAITAIKKPAASAQPFPKLTPKKLLAQTAQTPPTELNLPPLPPRFGLASVTLVLNLCALLLQTPQLWRWYTDWRARQNLDFFTSGFV